MVRAFCPGHVSCIFQPVSSYDVMGTGSRGVGIRLSLGAEAEVVPRDDGEVVITMDGSPSEAPVTRDVVGSMAPGRGFDVVIENGLPVSQGFGMSAAGAIAVGLCVAELTGQTRYDAFRAAHVAEVHRGGGLGDVSAIVGGRDVPIRTVAGIPPFGSVSTAGFTVPRLTLAVLGPVMETGHVLSDPETVAVIREAAMTTMDGFMADPTYENLIVQSNLFSSATGLESDRIADVIERLSNRGYGAGMCMLGNSVFTDAPERELWSMLGRGHVRTFECSSSHREAIVRRE